MYEQDLRRVEIFRDLGDEELRHLTGLFEEVNIGTHQMIFRQGDRAEAFYVIREGDVVVFRDGGEGEPVQLLARLSAGDHFGEFGIYDELIRTASVRTNGPSRILRIHKQALLTVLLKHPTVALRLQTAASRHHTPGLPGLGRRHEVRTIIDKEVVLMLHDGTSMKARLLDLSRGGLCLAGASEVWEIGEHVRFHLGLGSGMLQLGGQVTWIRDDSGTVGISFTQRSQGHNMKIQWALRQLVGSKKAVVDARSEALHDYREASVG